MDVKTELALGLVPKHYLMNPSTERLITSGRELKDGMIVLTANEELRADTRNIEIRNPDQARLATAYRWNRWMRISEVHHGPAVSNTSFVGTYHDGSKMAFSTHPANPWFVKLSDEGWEWTQS